MKTTTENRGLEVAKSILFQLKAMGQVEMWSWGARDFCVTPESKEFAGGLIFKTNGFKHKGWVSIKLRNDLYHIFLTNNKGEVVKSFTEVYFDEMVNMIDEAVEYTGENYKKDVNAALYKL
jgi:hypothetical protein